MKRTSWGDHLVASAAPFGPSQALRFAIAPRYTVGCPAQVRESDALAVARREREAYEDMLRGRYGETKQRIARELGLAGIVEERWEFRGRRMFRDVLTGQVGTGWEERKSQS